MPKQMKGASFKVSPGKAGSGVKKYAPVGLFKPRTQGISAHGMTCRMESVREAKDRLVG